MIGVGTTATISIIDITTIGTDIIEAADIIEAGIIDKWKK